MCVSVSEKYIYVHKYKQEDTYICMYTIVKNKVYVCTCLYTYTVYVSKCDFYCVILCIYIRIYIYICFYVLGEIDERCLRNFCPCLQFRLTGGMSEGPVDSSVGPQLKAAWSRVWSLLVEQDRVTSFRVEALRRIRIFYGELQDLAEGIPFAPEIEGVPGATVGVAAPGVPGVGEASLLTEETAPGEAAPGKEDSEDTNQRHQVALEGKETPERAKSKDRHHHKDSKKEKKDKKESKEKKRKKRERKREREKPSTAEIGDEVASPVTAAESRAKRAEEKEESLADTTPEAVGVEEVKRRSLSQGGGATSSSRRAPEVRERSPRRSERASEGGRRSRSRVRSGQRQRGSSGRRRRSRSRRRRSSRASRSRPAIGREHKDSRRPAEPSRPPTLVYSWGPPGPPPGIFQTPYFERRSKGVNRRLRNWDIRQYGTDPARKDARVQHFGTPYRG